MENEIYNLIKKIDSIAYYKDIQINIELTKCNIRINASKNFLKLYLNDSFQYYILNEEKHQKYKKHFVEDDILILEKYLLELI